MSVASGGLLRILGLWPLQADGGRSGRDRCDAHARATGQRGDRAGPVTGPAGDEPGHHRREPPCRPQAGRSQPHRTGDPGPWQAAAGQPVRVVSSYGLRITIAAADGVTRLCVIGDLDMATVLALQVTLAEVLASRPERLELDLAGVSFLSSVGLRVLADAHVAADGSLRIVSASHSVLFLIDLLGVRDFFDITSPGKE
jgi:anti-anti-sigma factor